MPYICPNCGAACDEAQPRCPYCDTPLPRGAQREYMETLGGIRKELAGLQEAPATAVKTELRRQGQRLRRIAAAALLVLLLLALLFFLQERRYARDNTADLVWQHENYPYMTELYEAGRYEELRDFYFAALEEDRPLWNWEYDEEFWETLEDME